MAKKARANRSRAPRSFTHDHYVRSAFQQEDLALAFFQYAFEKSSCPSLNWDSLRSNSDSYVDEELRQHFTDICFTCQTFSGQPLLISLLVEHKSQDPPKGSLRIQLVRYLSNAEEKNLKNKEPFVLTIPIVLYHGPRAMTRYSKGDLYPDYPEAYLSYTYDFEFMVIDLYQAPEEELQQLPKESLKILFKALKYGRDSELLSVFWVDYLTFVSSTSEGGQLSHLATITTQYLFLISKPFKARLKSMKQYSTFPSKEENYMEAVEMIAKFWYKGKFKELKRQAIEEGRAEGRAEGKAEGRAEGRAEGKAEGRAEGKAEGRAEGKQEGMEIGIKEGLEKGMEMALKSFQTKHPSMKLEELASLFDLEVEAVKRLLERK